MIETIIISILSTTVIFAIGGIIYLLSKVHSLRESLLDSALHGLTVENELEDLLKDYENLSVADPDGFIKFLSESRDWAFKYIEDVQASIVELYNALESEDQAKIKSSYEQLMKYLPKEDAK